MIELYTFDSSNGQRAAIAQWLADELSIADFSLYPLCAVRKGIIDAAGNMPDLTRWTTALAARAGVARAMRAA